MKTLLSLFASIAVGAPAAADGGCEVIGRMIDQVVPPAESAAPLMVAAIFNANVTNAQRAVINEALAEWSGMITSAGHIVNPYVIVFLNGPLTGDTLARASTTWNSAGVLTGSTITIDNDGTSLFFVDPTPDTNEEFDANGDCLETECVFTDLLTVMRHEIGHALGWNGAYGSTTNPLTSAYISGLTFDAARLNIAMDPAFTSHSDAAVHANDLMNPSISSGKRRELEWYPSVALTARNIDHSLILRFVDVGSTSAITLGTADLPWKSVSSAVANEATGTPFLVIPGTYDENPFTIASAHEFFAARGATVLIK